MPHRHCWLEGCPSLHSHRDRKNSFLWEHQPSSRRCLLPCPVFPSSTGPALHFSATASAPSSFLHILLPSRAKICLLVWEGHILSVGIGTHGIKWYQNDLNSKGNVLDHVAEKSSFSLSENLMKNNSFFSALLSVITASSWWPQFLQTPLLC